MNRDDLRYELRECWGEDCRDESAASPAEREELREVIERLTVVVVDLAYAYGLDPWDGGSEVVIEALPESFRELIEADESALADAMPERLATYQGACRECGVDAQLYAAFVARRRAVLVSLRRALAVAEPLAEARAILTAAGLYGPDARPCDGPVLLAGWGRLLAAPSDRAVTLVEARRIFAKLDNEEVVS